ncbi:GNAT family N-acetyltransferase [Candidatus Synechococcus calcipolaris G9]|uniref:GNAT family N-acetyltransferase n=1 Tax=Candidatus Synechococcus calcipolaris G9 TaxID=1497997 RepID=A0ABT6F324_9SYNE|nr:GNAT family N-acetyltransferase [Candidatus Synechococcus calcipolaris]MDG2992276.1 GNAT family N-acetyltransferase [Candidatus Synechococcus calcipolaris G9]
MHCYYGDYLIRSWESGDRPAVISLLQQILKEFNLNWEPEGADRDVVHVEAYYLERGGEFWVVEKAAEVVGTAAYYPIDRGDNAVEIRKMYLHPQVRGKGLGTFLLQSLEKRIQSQGITTIWIETASVMKTAIGLYEKQGYQPATGIETQRCDRVYVKQMLLQDN